MELHSALPYTNRLWHQYQFSSILSAHCLSLWFPFLLLDFGASCWKVSPSCWSNHWLCLTSRTSWKQPAITLGQVTMMSLRTTVLIFPCFLCLHLPNTFSSLQKDHLEQYIALSGFSTQNHSIGFLVRLPVLYCATKAYAVSPMTNSPRSFSPLCLDCFQSLHLLAFALLYILCTYDSPSLKTSPF